MKKIGILTFHHVHNFGAVFQAWALSHTLTTMGYKAEVVDYRPQDAHTVGNRKGLKALVPSLGKLRMDRFVHRHIPLSKPLIRDRAALQAYIASKGYDALVCGSDQVWYTLDPKNYDPAYFLDFADVGAARRVSYAPSSGPLDDFGVLTDKISQALTAFNAISVRDANTQAAVTKLGLQPITRVVDPTMIADFSPLMRGPAKRDFIAVVGKTDAAADRYIRFAAQSLGLPAVGFGTRCAGADKNQPFASPSQWLNAVSGARFVVTSLFHGAAISLSVRTPFVALDCGGRAFKLEDLCGHCTIPERLLTQGESGEYAQDSALLAMDYTSIERRLQDLAQQSRAYLKGAIDG